MSRAKVTPIRQQKEQPDPAGEFVIGEVALDVRQFLRCSWQGEDTWADQEGLDEGRALVEDFALLAAARAADLSADVADAFPLDLHQIARVLQFVNSLRAKPGGNDCFGHSGGESACGFNHILDWAITQIRRHAGAQS